MSNIDLTKTSRAPAKIDVANRLSDYLPLGTSSFHGLYRFGGGVVYRSVATRVGNCGKQGK